MSKVKPKVPQQDQIPPEDIPLEETHFYRRSYRHSSGLGLTLPGIGLSRKMWEKIKSIDKKIISKRSGYNIYAVIEDIKHKHKGHKVIYIPYPYVDAVHSRYETPEEFEAENPGKNWAYTGFVFSFFEPEKDYHTILVYEDYEDPEKLIGQIHYRMEPALVKHLNTNRGTGGDVIPEVVQDTSLMKKLFHMPRKFWLRLPYVVQTEVYPGTLYLLFRYEFEVKKATVLGKVFGAILIIIGIVIIVASKGSATKVGASFIGAGISYYGAVYNIPALKILGFIISVWASWGNTVQTGAIEAGAEITWEVALQYANTALAVANTIVSAYSMLYDYNIQKTLQREADMTKEYIEETSKETQDIKNDLKGNFLDLTRYNISNPFKEMDEVSYMLYGEYDFDRVANGLIYNELQQPLYTGELYERYV